MWIDQTTGQVCAQHSDIRAAREASIPDVLTDEMVAFLGFTPASVCPAHDPITETLDLDVTGSTETGFEAVWKVTARPAAEAEAALDAARAEAIEHINAWRLAATHGSFEFQGKAISCDQLSRSDIDGVTSYVALTDQLPPNWPGAWKCLDNTWLPVPDVATWKALVGAMVATGTQLFMQAQTAKQGLAGVTVQTVEPTAAVAAIVVGVI